MLKKLNPLELSIQIPARSQPSGADSSIPSPIPSQIVYKRVLTYLGKLAEAEWRTKEHPILTRFSRGSDLVAAFKNQFHSYSLLRYPFDKPLTPGQSVRSWWCSLLEHPEANVLAVSVWFDIFAMSDSKPVHWQKALFGQAKLNAGGTYSFRVYANEFSPTKCSRSSYPS